MSRTSLSIVLVAGFSAVVWFPLKVHAQGSAPRAAHATLKRQPSSADTYLFGYLTMLDGDKLRTNKDFVRAYFKYRDARDTFDAVHFGEPSWNEEIVGYRRKKIRESMEEVRQEEIRRRAEGGEAVPQGSQEAERAVDPPGHGLTPLKWMEDLDRFFQLQTVPEGGGSVEGPTAPVPGSARVPETEPAAEAPVPVLVGSVLDGNLYSLSFNTVAGFSYQLESSTDLEVWESQGGAVAGDGSVKSCAAEVAGEGRQFFRIRGTMTGGR